jgi:two-component system, sensor histidine kinase PdtaS
VRILPASALLSHLRGLLRRGRNNSVLAYVLFAAVAVPVGLFVSVLLDDEMRSSALYFAPAIVALLILALFAWRTREEMESTVALRTRALSNDLREKEQLLREVHHRVKNNMQIISSLIRVQDRVKTSPEETIRRVQAMALVHDLISTQGQFASVDLAAYARRLCETLRGVGNRTTFDLRVERVTVPLDKAMPFALILSEVVANAMKHAWRDTAGTVTLTLSAHDGVAKLTVQDDGTNFNPEVDGRGFGLTLVDSLSTQLDAITSFEREHGSTFHMTFRVDA